eukprot:349039-Prorocentrum_minimum.AAC.1
MLKWVSRCVGRDQAGPASGVRGGREIRSIWAAIVRIASVRSIARQTYAQRGPRWYTTLYISERVAYFPLFTLRRMLQPPKKRGARRPYPQEAYLRGVDLDVAEVAVRAEKVRHKLEKVARRPLAAHEKVLLRLERAVHAHDEVAVLHLRHHEPLLRREVADAAAVREHRVLAHHLIPGGRGGPRQGAASLRRCRQNRDYRNPYKNAVRRQVGACVALPSARVSHHVSLVRAGGGSPTEIGSPARAVVGARTQPAGRKRSDAICYRPNRKPTTVWPTL